MGIVYRARDPRIGREVAIKTIKPADQAETEEIEGLRERLFREAQSAGRLSHPGIVTIFDVDEQDGLVYIAMELVEGRTLDRYVAAAGGTARSLDFAVELLLRVGDALDYAHRRGIVHRDVKPANIMISSDEVKIMDFGVARIVSSQLTRTGAVMGTPNYMSPEQVKGEEIDGRSDQFSLGVIAYELLTGKKPFQAENLPATIFKIVSAEPVRPRQWNPELSPALDEAVLRALAKAPDSRFATCSEFAEAVAAAVKRIRAGGKTVVLPAGLAESDEGDETTGDAVARPDVAHVRPRSEDGPVAGAGGSAGKDEPAAAEAETADGKIEAQEARPILPEPARKRRAAKSAPGGAAGAAGDVRGLAAERAGGKRHWPLAILLLLFAAVGGLTFFLYNNPALLDDPGRLIQIVLGPAPAGDAGGPITPPAPAAPEPQSTSSGGADNAAPGGRAEAGSGPNPTEPAADPVSSEPSPAAVETTAQPPASTPPSPPVSPPGSPISAPQAVTFRSNAAGAEIMVDRRVEWTCTAPCEPMQLPPGEHTATAALDGYRLQRQSFDIGAEPLEISFLLQPVRATLMVTSRPTDGDIYIDGRKTGRKTAARIAVAPGRRVVRVIKGGLSAEQTIEAADGRLHTLDFTLGSR